MLPTLTPSQQPSQRDRSALDAKIAKARSTASTLRAPVLASWDERPVLYLQKGEPWLLVPAERDPLRTLKGGVFIPDRALADLQRIVAAGLDFERIAIAHEVTPAHVPADLRGAIPNQGRPCTDEVAARLVGDLPAPTKTLKSAARLDSLVSKIVNATAATTAGLLAAGLSDPIVFGVLGPEGGPRPGRLAAYFPLAAWHW